MFGTLETRRYWQERGNWCPVRGLGWCVLISDFPDLLTSDGARKVVPVKLEPEFKKKKISKIK